MRSTFLWLMFALVLSSCSAGKGAVRVLGEDGGEFDYARAAKIAAALIGPLQRIEASLAHWKACLDRQTCEPEKFLSQIETALLEALRAPELAGLRDWVRAEFRSPASTIQFYRTVSGTNRTGEIAEVFQHEWNRVIQPNDTRDALRSASQATRAVAARLPPANKNPIRPAAQAQPRWGRDLAGIVPYVFADVARLVRRTREMVESKDGIITNLCVQSSPNGAMFILWPSSEPVQRRSGVSIGTLVIYRGLYAYDITMAQDRFRCNPGPGDFARCSKIDLVNDGRPVFYCADADVRGDVWEWQCNRREGPLDGCTTAP